jgi:hypothetical protein
MSAQKCWRKAAVKRVVLMKNSMGDHKSRFDRTKQFVALKDKH